MEQVLQLFNQYNMYITIGLSGIIVVLIILIIINTKKVSRIQAKYEKFMQKEDMDLEELLMHYAKKVNKIQEHQIQSDKMIKDIQEELKFCVQKVGVIRYKAIENIGADLSFVIALLDANDDGVVINGIYSRDGSYTYAKPIEKGDSKYTLSDEEQEALQRALKN